MSGPVASFPEDAMPDSPVRSIQHDVPEPFSHLRQETNGNGSVSASFESILKPLTARQLTAINLLTLGKTAVATARTIGVSETTLHRWKRDHPLFIAELARRQGDLFDAMISKLRKTMSCSIDELYALATSKNRYERREVMREMLKLLKPQKYLVPTLLSDPREIVDERVRARRRSRGEVEEAPISEEDRKNAVDPDFRTDTDTTEDEDPPPGGQSTPPTPPPPPMPPAAPAPLASTAPIPTLSPMSQRTAFLPGQPWPDNNGVHLNAHGAGLLEHEGVYYLFGEHKIVGKIGNTAQVGVHVYRSTDLYNWTDAGIALRVVDDARSEIVRGCVIERPKVVRNAKTKKFVMFFHLELKGQGYHAARTAIAVADKPEGPYTYQRSLRPNAGHWPMNFDAALRSKKHVFETHPSHEQVVEGVYCQRDYAGGQMARDMTLFVDDDQAAYLVCSAEENYTLNVHELSDDYLDFTGRYARILPGGHNEAPAICKHQGTYHLLASGCTGWAPNAARSATASSLLGPWTPGGNPCVGVNPHNGKGPELTFGGQSTHIHPMPGAPGRFIAMFDLWTPQNPIDGGYIWLPLDLDDGRMVIQWQDQWTIGQRSTA